MRLPTLLVVLTSFLTTAAIGCGGGKKATNEGSGEPVVSASDAQASESPEQKFERQKDDAVDKMCQRLIDCSLADAEVNMPPEELAELNKNREGITNAAIAKCNEEFGGGMSPRQVISLRECLGEPTECPEFNDCLESAMKPPSAAASD